MMGKATVANVCWSSDEGVRLQTQLLFTSFLHVSSIVYAFVPSWWYKRIVVIKNCQSYLGTKNVKLSI